MTELDFLASKAERLAHEALAHSAALVALGEVYLKGSRRQGPGHPLPDFPQSPAASPFAAGSPFTEAAYEG